MFLYTLNVLLAANLPEVLGHLYTEQFSGTTKCWTRKQNCWAWELAHLQLGLGFSVAEGAQSKVDKMVELMLAVFS